MHAALDGFRYYLGIVTAIAVPLGISYWLVLHAFARLWRRWGAPRTYLLLLPVLFAAGVLLFRMRGRLLGTDLGTNGALIVIALVLCCPMIWLELQYWRKLKLATLLGIPEVSKHTSGTLMHDGIYGVVRHPRYLSAGIGLLVNALIANYSGLYLLLAAALAPGYLMLRLEERELVERFGDAYREYQAHVPQLIPFRRKPS
jgi:protein-S-isoprenylcysteine O-methyltransferase Ste14